MGCTQVAVAGPLEAMEPLPELYSIFQGEVRARRVARPGPCSVGIYSIGLVGV